MIRFHSDLDNTILYSYKHEIGETKNCVEVYQGRQISYMTHETARLLSGLKEKMSIVPTTTRTVEQYKRLDLSVISPKYALVCNGGALLVDGEEDMDWYKESLALISDSREMLKYGEWLLGQDENRCFEVRNIKGLFIFTKSEKPFTSVMWLKERLDESLTDIFSNGAKVYIVPKRLNKGMAVSRFQKRYPSDLVIAAGDSEFDIPMLNEARLAVAPRTLKGGKGIKGHITYMRGRKLFSEEGLEYITNIIR